MKKRAGGETSLSRFKYSQALLKVCYCRGDVLVLEGAHAKFSKLLRLLYGIRRQTAC